MWRWGNHGRIRLPLVTNQQPAIVGESPRARDAARPTTRAGRHASAIFILRTRSRPYRRGDMCQPSVGPPHASFDSQTVAATAAAAISISARVAGVQPRTLTGACPRDRHKTGVLHHAHHHPSHPRPGPDRPRIHRPAGLHPARWRADHRLRPRGRRAGQGGGRPALAGLLPGRPRLPVPAARRHAPAGSSARSRSSASCCWTTAARAAARR